jgi:hypothetical protein
LQSSDGIVEIRAAMKEILGSCRQHELTIVRRLRRRGDPIHGELEIIDGAFWFAGRILD